MIEKENTLIPKKMRIELEDMAFTNRTTHEKYIVKIYQENEYDQTIRIKRINDEFIIEIPDDSGYYTEIVINPKERTVIQR